MSAWGPLRGALTALVALGALACDADLLGPGRAPTAPPSALSEPPARSEDAGGSPWTDPEADTAAAAGGLDEGPPADPCDDPTPRAWLALDGGSAEAAAQAALDPPAALDGLDAGDALPLVLGPQGGYHVEVALRFAHLGGVADVTLWARAGDAEVSRGRYRLGLPDVAAGGCIADIRGLYAILDTSGLPGAPSPPDALHGAALRLGLDGEVAGHPVAFVVDGVAYAPPR
jgi:hypothetical protein